MPRSGLGRGPRPNFSFLVKGMLNTSAPSRPQGSGNRRPLGLLYVFLASAALVCFVLCAGCVSFMRNWTPWISGEAKQPDKRAAAETSSRANAALKKSKEAERPAESVRDGSRSSVKVSTKDLETDKATQEKRKGSPKSRTGLPEKKNGSKGAASIPPKQDRAHALPATAKDKTDKNGPAAGSADESEDKLDKSKSFKKHDHVEYVELIKSKASDLIKKERDCTLARLCRNSITDEWSLTVYVAQQKYFSFVVYSWDEIDEKWENSYASEKRPASQFAHHLRFSSAGKECTDLKGSQR